MRRPLRPVAEFDAGFPPLKARIIARTGHHYYADKDDLLFDRLRKRFRACGLADATAYLAHLDGEATGPAEWAALEAEITIGETFFFRYAEQFTALRSTILPGLVAARAQTRTLRIWSAGCSTGAEPYSIAILLHELLGSALPDWRIAVTGTDISAEALATARAGVFGRWALRTLPPEEHERYFILGPSVPGIAREGSFALRPEFRRMVRFEYQNLMGLLDGTTPSHFAEFDLVLCRNVLIYFQAEAVLGIVRGLGRRLAPDGWLLLGHAEPNPAFADILSPVNLPGTVAYRRRDGTASLPQALPDILLTGLPESPPDASSGGVAEGPVPAAPALPVAPSVAPFQGPSPALPARAPSLDADDGSAEKSFSRQGLSDATRPGGVGRGSGDVASIIVSALPGEPPAAPVEPQGEDDPEAVLAAIRDLADTGRIAEGWRRVRTALLATPTDPRLHYYDGLLAYGLGREAEAERALRGALYLDRAFVMAHYQLGLLLGALGRRAEAGRALDNAIRFGRDQRPDALVAEGDGMTASQLVESAHLARTR